MYSDPIQPLPSGLDIQLGLALSKHATYTANVDDLPLTPEYIIIGKFAAIQFYYDNDYPTYLILSALATDVFYACITEQFVDQGGTFSNRRINVGEPAHPINSSRFIKAGELNTKLSEPIW